MHNLGIIVSPWSWFLAVILLVVSIALLFKYPKQVNVTNLLLLAIALVSIFKFE